MGVALNYNNVINDPQIDIDKLIAKINFYLSSNIIAKICRRLGALKRLRRDIIGLNKQLKHCYLQAFALYSLLKEKDSDTANIDLSDVIVALQKRIDLHIILKESVDAFISQYGYKKIDFRTVQYYANQMLDLDYKLLTFFKKANKKVPRTTSDLAKQSSNYSLQNLSEILNAH